jgi:hypothetical protein
MVDVRVLKVTVVYRQSRVRHIDVMYCAYGAYARC